MALRLNKSWLNINFLSACINYLESSNNPLAIGVFWKVFLAFASAAIKIRISGISSTMGKEVDKNILQYNFGMMLKETMINLGPTFIKSK